MNSFTFHGGNLVEAVRRFGGMRERWLDLSTGINPVPWPVAKAPRFDWTALPAPDALARLETRAAAHFGIDPAMCCAVPGSEVGLRMVASLLGLPGRVVEPGYRTHREAFATVETAGFGTHPGGAASHVLANPGNPDGARHERAALLRWERVIARKKGWLVVDEAFADADPAESLAGEVGEERNLVVLRSFGKFFGLAGVRLGFVLAPVNLVARLRERMGSWPIHAGALAIGEAAYADGAWIASTRRYLVARAGALDAVLARHGLVAEGHCPLFRLVRDCDALRLFEGLARARILVRPFADEPGWLRLGVPAGPADLARLDAALAVLHS